MGISDDVVKPLESNIKSLLLYMESTVDVMTERSKNEKFDNYRIGVSRLRLFLNDLISCIDRLQNHIISSDDF
ncbi:hypothetical protein [Solidesulfovibrio alcoholivorans]|uniref:hypothetical protein n=1 Tax=Solidesulfovibrio alcoholivorans TaxID=81406 RepID=UPI0012EC8F4A|nr:hypothetical protein [Solidesulfovibrio alcoholivorans]